MFTSGLKTIIRHLFLLFFRNELLMSFLICYEFALVKSFNKDEILARVFSFFLFQLLTRVDVFNKSGGENPLILIRAKETWIPR